MALPCLEDFKGLTEIAGIDWCVQNYPAEDSVCMVSVAATDNFFTPP